MFHVQIKEFLSASGLKNDYSMGGTRFLFDMKDKVKNLYCLNFE